MRTMALCASSGKCMHVRAVARILAWGVLKLGGENSRGPKGREWGTLLGEGTTTAPFPPARGLGRALHVSSPSVVRGGARPPSVFLHGHYMAFPCISVASGRVSVAKYFSAIHHVSAEELGMKIG